MLTFLFLEGFLFFCVCFLVTPCSLQYLSSPAGDWTQSMAMKAWNPNLLATREIPAWEILDWKSVHFIPCYCKNRHWVTFYNAIEEYFPYFTLIVAIGHSGFFIFLDNLKGDIHAYYKSNLDWNYRILQNLSR